VIVNFIVYKTATGEIVRTGACSSDAYAATTVEADETIMQGVARDDIHYIVSGVVTAKGSRPSQYHEFNFTTQQWDLNSGRQAENARSSRDALLAGCDWTQLPDSPLSDADKTAWATYRTALRDVPSQSGFPGNIDWPTPPDEA